MTLPTDGAVPVYRPAVTLSELAIGEPVRASTLLAMGRLAQWVRGRGRVLVPSHAPMATLVGVDSATLHYYTQPSGVAISRVWVIEVIAGGAGTLFTMQAGAGATSPAFDAWGAAGLSGAYTAGGAFVYVETGCTKTTGAVDLDFTIATTYGDGLFLVSLACYELPRAALARSAADLGIALDSFGPRKAIYEAAGVYEGISAIESASLATPPRRGALAAWWNRDGAYFTSGAYTPLFVEPIPLLPGKDRVAATTRVVAWNVYAYATDAVTTGAARLADAGGGHSSTIAINDGTPQWRTEDSSLSIDCEDLTEANGVPGGVYPTIQLEVIVTAGPGSIVVHGFDVWEWLA